MGLSRIVPVAGLWVRGIGAVLLVLLGALLLLALNALLLVPGLMLGFAALGIPWHWQGMVPAPVVPPHPWVAMALGVLASLVPASLDAAALHMLLGRSGRQARKGPGGT